MTNLHVARAALGGVVTTALMLAGTTLTAGSAGATASPVITPAQALKTVTAYFPVNNKANAKHDSALVKTIESDSVAFEDESYFDIAHALHLSPESGFTGAAVQVYVPYQTGYPAVFVAQFRFHPKGEAVDKKSVAFFLFSKDKPASHWTLSSSSVVGTGDPLPTFTVGSDGYLPPLPTLSVGRSQLETLWIKALRTTSTTGKVPGKPWRPTPLLAGFAARETNSVDRELTYKATPWAPVCVAATGGGVCFATVATIDRNTLTKDELTKGNYYSVSTTSEQIDSGGLPRGNYASLTTYKIRTGLLVVPKKGSAGLRLVGSESDIVGGTGQPY